jgi:hypothetical protein
MEEMMVDQEHTFNGLMKKLTCEILRCIYADFDGPSWYRR